MICRTFRTTCCSNGVELPENLYKNKSTAIRSRLNNNSFLHQAFMAKCWSEGVLAQALQRAPLKLHVSNAHYNKNSILSTFDASTDSAVALQLPT